MLSNSGPSIEPWGTPDDSIGRQNVYCLSSHFVYVFVKKNKGI